ncbi:hypothetical protein [Sinorhizobium meliloti]|uniref:hypothetical protein n=1 Tax=Rhizobium meliloti TaxID=382 RepID=UPI001F436463|nr:hypothetical protein [Sinorhizobium meliloti]
MGTDAADAENICEVVALATMRFVPVKSAEQQAGARGVEDARSGINEVALARSRKDDVRKMMCGNRQ